MGVRRASLLMYVFNRDQAYVYFGGKMVKKCAHTRPAGSRQRLSGSARAGAEAQPAPAARGDSRDPPPSTRGSRAV